MTIPEVREIPDLSVVIIARNEAQNIARAIESVLRAVERWPHTEILLVDSASTDATVEIAKRYPINIVRLDRSWYLSVAAGRYIGSRYARGQLILHMDGDMEMDPEWVDRCVPFMLAHPEAAVVGGYWTNVYICDGDIVDQQDFRRDVQRRTLEARFVAGAALHRRSALEQVGGFNPYIKGEEDVELCLRLRHAGYKVLRLPYRMALHYGLPENSWAYCMRRLRSNLWIGYGQVPRYHLKSGLFWIALRERNLYTVGYLIGMLVFTINVVLAVFAQNAALLAVWVLTVGPVLVAFWIKKRSLRATLKSLILQGLIACSAVRGFLMTPRSPADYPTNVEVVQTYYHRQCPT